MIGGIPNMYKTNKMILIIILSVLMSIIITTTCYGNSAEPPSILIIVPNAPDDLEISIKSGDTYIYANKINKVIETYYTFYSRDLRDSYDYNLKVSSSDSSFEVPLNKPLKSYNNIFTLDIKNKILKRGKALSRSISLVLLRVSLTLIIEGLIFWLFGYRHKKSWKAFFAINLITQGLLNIWLNGSSPLQSYIILSLIFGEILILIAEVISFSIFVKEHRKLRTISYVIIANMLSLVAGGYIITLLPI